MAATDKYQEVPGGSTRVGNRTQDSEVALNLYELVYLPNIWEVKRGH